MDWIDTGLYAANDFCQAFVDMIPGGRTIVDGTHGVQNWASGEHYDYNALTNKGSGAYMAGTGGGLIWNAALGAGCLRKLVMAAPGMAASRISYVAYVGRAVQTTRAIQTVDSARKFMELTRASMYMMKLWFNQKRLNSGRITRKQFDSMLDNDRINYQMGASLWALPGTGGLWIAAASMAFGNILNQMNMETMAKGK